MESKHENARKIIEDVIRHATSCYSAYTYEADGVIHLKIDSRGGPSSDVVIEEDDLVAVERGHILDRATNIIALVQRATRFIIVSETVREIASDSFRGQMDDLYERRRIMENELYDEFVLLDFIDR